MEIGLQWAFDLATLFRRSGVMSQYFETPSVESAVLEGNSFV
jgi:hypothetical protein